jgi:phosphinothricin acetyltransferase
MPSDVLIRHSDEADIAAIAAIYRHHVLYGTASFEETPPDAAEISRRRREVDRVPSRARVFPGSACCRRSTPRLGRRRIDAARPWQRRDDNANRQWRRS